MNRSVDILIPTFNRKQFSKQIVCNINKQNYPFINKVIVADDGTERLDMTGCKYPVEYYSVARMSIGDKRNYLNFVSRAYYIANMDTDDIYNPNYISICIFNLLRTGKYITGSADMILSYEKKYYIHRCCYINYLNEATIVCVNNNRKYRNSNSSEGLDYLHDMSPYIVETDIRDIMVCLVHKDNSVKKNHILHEEIEKPTWL